MRTTIAIQWTLWGKQAENAAEYLGKGSHVNIVGRLSNNNYEKDGALKPPCWNVSTRDSVPPTSTSPMATSAT